MGVKTYSPTTSSLRHRTGLTYEELTTSEPYKPLVRPLKKSGGRDSRGRISIRFRGGGHKRSYRIIDFKRDKIDIPGEVELMWICLVNTQMRVDSVVNVALENEMVFKSVNFN